LNLNLFRKDHKNFESDFKLLVQTHHQKIYWQVRRMVYDHDDANDVVQDIFIKIFQNFENFKGDAKFSTWIFRIAYNETINFLNKRSRQNAVSLDEYVSSTVESLYADEYFDGDETQLLLQKAIAKLPEKQRMVFLYKYYEELKYEEISEIMGVSVGGLKASYHIASSKIKEIIQQQH